MEDYRTIKIDSLELRIGRFDAETQLKIGRRVFGNFASALTQGGIKQDELQNTEGMSEEKKSAFLGVIGKVLSSLSDDDFIMIFRESLAITQIKKDVGYTNIVQRNGNERPTYLFDDVEKLFCNFSKELKFLWEVISHNFFGSLKDMPSPILKQG